MNFKPKSMTEFKQKGDILEYGVIPGGKLNKYNRPVNLKAFYMELYDLLQNNKKVRFYDMVGDPDKVKVGEFFGREVKHGEQVDNAGNLNRKEGIYETKFVWSKMQNAVEFELEFKAYCKTPHSGYGWAELKIDLVNRFMQDKEFLVGNDKVVLQTGTWEFRNTLIYKNSVIKDFLNKVPIVKNNDHFKHLYLDHYYEKFLEEDVYKFVDAKIKPLINGLITKHFG